MKILLVANEVIPSVKYGGTERVVNSLGCALHEMGHQVTLMAGVGSRSTWGGELIQINPLQPIHEQIDGKRFDVAHLNMQPAQELDLPYIITQHGNSAPGATVDSHTVFVSKNHAMRHNSSRYVLNGLDWREYGDVELGGRRTHFHFLGKAAWRVKNVKGAIKVVTDTAHERLVVLGGSRLNIKMGFRLTLSPRVRFAGMVDNEQKVRAMVGSKGLIFPVLWDEPFGLALIESLYCGCPVFGANRGSLPEIIGEQYGVLSNELGVLTESLSRSFDVRACHQYALDRFGARRMAADYLAQYEFARSSF